MFLPLFFMIANLYQLIQPNPFVISSEKVLEITQACEIEVDELLKQLVPIARSYAKPPISNYKVGVAVLGSTGAIYLGVNLEFPGFPLNQSVHGEQFALSSARSHGETELVALGGSAAPCGHCRQFLNEMGSDIRILIPDHEGALTTFLPDAFGPADLGLTGGLLDRSAHVVAESSLAKRAIQAAEDSYAPYTGAKSGVAILTKDGSVFIGSYLENAAFNPSLSPLHAALISLVSSLKSYDEICDVILAENPLAMVRQEVIAREIVKSIAPHATFSAVKLG